MKKSYSTALVFMCFIIFGCVELLPDVVKTLNRHEKDKEEPILMAKVKSPTMQSDGQIHPLNYYFTVSEFWDYIYDEVDPFGKSSIFRPPNRYCKNCSTAYSKALADCRGLECMQNSFEDLLRCYQIHMLPEVMVVENRELRGDS